MEKDTIVSVTWEVACSSGQESFLLKELNCNTIQEWHSLSKDDQRARLQMALDELPNRVSLLVDTFRLRD